MAGGSYLVARRIRMTDRDLGPHLARRAGDTSSAAPRGRRPARLGRASATRSSPTGCPPTSHVRLAHPSPHGGARLLRRGFNFVDGSDGLGHLDAGLFFLAYQRDPRRQFVPIQAELARNDADERVRAAHRLVGVGGAARRRPDRLVGRDPARLNSLGRVSTGAADRELVEDVRARLRAAGDPAKAPAMQAYMKSALPYYGVASPAARVDLPRGPGRPPAAGPGQLARDGPGALGRRHPPRGVVRRARRGRGTAGTPPTATPTRCRCTATCSRPARGGTSSTTSPPTWSGRCCWRTTRRCAPTVRAWATDDDRWLRRTAVIAQVGAKDRTDLDLLSHAIEANLDDRDFFLRKAIGWALRQHARTDPDWVRAFVAAHDDRISGLSRREALKHLEPA